MAAAWKWGAVTNSSFPSSPPLKPQKPLKAQHRPVLPGRTQGTGKKKTSGVGAACRGWFGPERALSHWSLRQCFRVQLSLTPRSFRPGETSGETSTPQDDLGSG